MVGRIIEHPVFMGKLFEVDTFNQGLVPLSKKPERKEVPLYHGSFIIEPEKAYIVELGEHEKSSSPQFESFKIDSQLASHGIICSIFKEDGKDMCLMTKITKWPVQINSNALIGTLMTIS